MSRAVEAKGSVDPVPVRAEPAAPGPGDDPAFSDDLVVVMDRDQCWERLSRSRVGRIAFRTAQSVEILPVNYVSSAGRVLFATASRAIRAAIDAGDELVFEVDEHDGWSAWSVVVHGCASPHAADEATARRIRSMAPPAPRATFVIEPVSVSGRLFDQSTP